MGSGWHWLRIMSTGGVKPLGCVTTSLGGKIRGIIFVPILQHF